MQRATSTKTFTFAKQHKSTLAAGTHLRSKAKWPNATCPYLEKPDWRLNMPGNVGLYEDQYRELPSKTNEEKLLREKQEEFTFAMNRLITTPPLSNRAEYALIRAAELTKVHRLKPIKEQYGLVSDNLRIEISNFLKENCKNVQFSANKMPQMLRERMDEVFLTPYRIEANENLKLVELHNMIKSPNRNLTDFKSCPTDMNLKTLVTVSFKTENDMASWKEDASKERMEKIEQFKSLANDLWYFLNSKGEFIDYIDPSTGLPWFSPNYYTSIQETSLEFDDIENLSIEDLGCCKVISHKDFKSNVFVGTIVTSAEFDNEFFKELGSYFKA